MRAFSPSLVAAVALPLVSWLEHVRAVSDSPPHASAVATHETLAPPVGEHTPNGPMTTPTTTTTTAAAAVSQMPSWIGRQPRSKRLSPAAPPGLAQEPKQQEPKQPLRRKRTLRLAVGSTSAVVNPAFPNGPNGGGGGGGGTNRKLSEDQRTFLAKFMSHDVSRFWPPSAHPGLRTEVRSQAYDDAVRVMLEHTGGEWDKRRMKRLARPLQQLPGSPHRDRVRSLYQRIGMGPNKRTARRIGYTSEAVDRKDKFTMVVLMEDEIKRHLEQAGNDPAKARDRVRQAWERARANGDESAMVVNKNLYKRISNMITNPIAIERARDRRKAAHGNGAVGAITSQERSLHKAVTMTPLEQQVVDQHGGNFARAKSYVRKIIGQDEEKARAAGYINVKTRLDRKLRSVTLAQRLMGQKPPPEQPALRARTEELRQRYVDSGENIEAMRSKLQKELSAAYPVGSKRHNHLSQLAWEASLTHTGLRLMQTYPPSALEVRERRMRRASTRAGSTSTSETESSWASTGETESTESHSDKRGKGKQVVEAPPRRPWADGGASSSRKRTMPSASASGPEHLETNLSTPEAKRASGFDLNQPPSPA